QSLGRLYAVARTFGGLGVVKGRAGDRIREGSGRAAVVYLRLRALGFQVGENSRKLRDLPFLELELVGQEAQRPAHAERAALIAPARVPLVVVRGSAARPTASAAGMLTTVTIVTGLPPRIETWMHDVPPSAGAIAPGGLSTWAQCLTCYPK